MRLYFIFSGDEGKMKIGLKEYENLLIKNPVTKDGKRYRNDRVKLLS